MRALPALGGAVAVLGGVMLVWGAHQQVALADCQVHCTGRNYFFPVTAAGIVLLLGGAFLAAWAAVARLAGRVLSDAGEDPARKSVESRERAKRAS